MKNKHTKRYMKRKFIRCINCNKKFLIRKSDKNKFCSYTCYWNNIKIKRKIIECKYCHKKIKEKHINQIFCSRLCANKYIALQPKILLSRKKTMQDMIKNKKGLFSFKIIKKNTLTRRKKKIGAWHSEKRKWVNEIVIPKLRKEKLGSFFNPEQNRQLRINLAKNRRTYSFNNILFDSKFETEIAMCIHYQIEKLKERKNCHFLIGLKEIDFKLNNLYVFIEVHCKRNWVFYKDRYYFQHRRKVLNTGGYNKWNLIVIS